MLSRNLRSNRITRC